jgi:hypothetical protein
MVLYNGFGGQIFFCTLFQAIFLTLQKMMPLLEKKVWIFERKCWVALRKPKQRIYCRICPQKNSLYAREGPSP